MPKDSIYERKVANSHQRFQEKKENMSRI